MASCIASEMRILWLQWVERRLMCFEHGEWREGSKINQKTEASSPRVLWTRARSLDFVLRVMESHCSIWEEGQFDVYFSKIILDTLYRVKSEAKDDKSKRRTRSFTSQRTFTRTHNSLYRQNHALFEVAVGLSLAGSTLRPLAPWLPTGNTMLSA